MDELQQRVVKCFELVFPDLTEGEIPKVSQASYAGWDSTAAITLVNVIEDEFGIELDLDQLSELDSFERVCTYLRKTIQAAV